MTDDAAAFLAVAEHTGVARTPPPGDDDNPFNDPIEPPPPVEREPTSWVPVDLDEVLKGDLQRPTTTVLQRSDGAHLLYPGRVHLLYGRPESCKSWVALMAVVEVVQAGGDALLVDLESEPTEVIPRLLALQLSKSQIRDRIRYMRPTDPLDIIRYGIPGNADRDLADALDPAPQLIVIDAVGELFALHALDPLSNRDAPTVTGFLRRLAEKTGATVVALDHVPHTKREGASGSAPIGAQHKLAAVTGAAYEVKAHKPLAPGKTGETSLYLAKDRPGAVRAATIGKVAARITLDAQTHPNQILTSIQPDGNQPGHRSDALKARIDRVRQVLTDAGDQGLSKRAIRTEIGGNNPLTDDAITALVDDGEIHRRPGRGNALQHVLISQPKAPVDVPL